jgi:hypothetical protein
MSKDGIKEINPINIDTKGTNINYSGASRKISGKAALKKTIKEIKKTPNKNFKQGGLVKAGKPENCNKEDICVIKAKNKACKRFA